MGQAKVVVGAITVRSLLDDLAEVGEAGFEIALEEELCALCKVLLGFAGYGEFLDGDDGIVAGGGGDCGFAQMEHERTGGGKTGGELEHIAGGSGDGNAIGCGGELIETKLAVVVGESGKGGAGIREEKFNISVRYRAVFAREKDRARGGNGGVRGRERLRETHER